MLLHNITCNIIDGYKLDLARCCLYVANMVYTMLFVGIVGVMNFKRVFTKQYSSPIQYQTFRPFSIPSL